MDRRNFIKLSAVAGASTALAGCGWMGGPLVRADLTRDQTAKAVPAGLTQLEAAILNHAALAPSGHNAQPWFVRVLEPGQWLMGLDQDRLLPAVDPDNREALLSLGAFVENLALAAGALGLPARIQVQEDRPLSEGFIRVGLGRSEPSGYPLERLTLRRTVKHGYLPDELKPADLKALSAPLTGRIHYFPAESEHGRCIAEGAIEAFRAQIARDEAMVETARWTRFSNKEARTHRDGLTPAGMEISGLAGFYVRNFMDSKDAAGERFRKGGLDLTAKLARQGGGWLIILGQSQSPAGLIETGRAFQRMALQLREISLAVHPMTQMLEEESGREAIRSNHLKGLNPQFILRVGYLDKYPDPVSLRRPPAWFVRT